MRRLREAIERRPGVWAWVLFVALAALGRLSSFRAPPGGDFGQNMYLGGVVLDGGTPYVDAANNKGPANFVLYALLRALCDGSPFAVRVILVLVTGLSALALAGVVAKHAGRPAGLVAGAALAVLSSAFQLEGYDPASYQFGMAPMLGAWWLATRPGPRNAAGAGALTSFAFLMNPSFAIVAPFVVWELLRGVPRGGWRERLLPALLGSVALALPFILWLLVTGALDDMLSQVFGQAQRALVPDRPGEQARLPGEPEAPLEFLLNLPSSVLWVAGTAGCLLALADRKLGPLAVAMLLWIGAWYLRVEVANYSFPNQYVPALAGIAAGLALAIETARPSAPGGRAVLAAVLLVGISWPSVVTPQLEELAKPAEARGSSALADVADFIEANTDPDERIFVEGYLPQVYWLADRRSATRYFDIFGLENDLEAAEERNRELLANPPAAISASEDAALDPGLRPMVRERYVLAFERASVPVWLLRD